MRPVLELAEAASADKEPLRWVHWDDITVGELVGQMAGIR